MWVRKKRIHLFIANFLAAASQSPSSSTFLTSEFFPAAPSPSATYPQDDSNTPILIGCLVTIILLLVIIIFLILWCQYVCKVLEKVSTNTTNLTKNTLYFISFFVIFFFFFRYKSLKLKKWFYSNEQEFFTRSVPFFWKTWHTIKSFYIYSLVLLSIKSESRMTFFQTFS